MIKKIELVKDTATGTENVQCSIRKMKFRQFEDVIKIVNDIYKLIQEDPALQTVFGELFREEDPIDPAVMEKFNDEEKAQILKDRRAQAEQRFIKGMMDSFQVLLVKVPTEAIRLLTCLSDIDRELLADQEFETVLDVYDAVLEVNNIEEIWERLKKSFDTTKRAMAFMKKRKTATGEIMPLQ